MNTQRTKNTPAEMLRDAAAVREELAAALADVGIVLPSLQVDPLAYGDHDPQPLIKLSSCNLTTARKLTAALRKAARAATTPPPD